jgi:hypothetical protein
VAVAITSIEGETGETGRMLGEIRKEHRDARKHNFLVPYHQVEFYEQRPDGRHRYYVPCPEWCRTEAWTSQHMFVAIHPCVNYRASRLLGGVWRHAETPFWWLVFESEWGFRGLGNLPILRHPLPGPFRHSRPRPRVEESHQQDSFGPACHLRIPAPV